MKYLRLIYLIAIVTLWSMLSITAQDEEILTIRLSDNDTVTLDPVFVGNTVSGQVVQSLTIGLTRVDPTTQAIAPGLATRWTRTILPDNTALYRFEVRNDVPWVRYDPEQHLVVEVLDDDGVPRMVSKEDIVYGILRAISPEFGGETAYFLAEAIQGGEDYVAGMIEAEDLSIQINVEDISILTPSLNVDLPLILTTSQAVPQPSWLIDDLGFDWATPDNYVSGGPYVLKSWTPDVEMTLIANPFWSAFDDLPTPTIDVLNFVFTPNDEVLQFYTAGEIDVVLDIPADMMSDILDNEWLASEFTQYPLSTVYFYGLNVRDTMATANLAFRQALAHAIDRDALLLILVKAGRIPAQQYLPDSIINMPDGMPSILPYNVELAQERLATALAELNLASVDDLPSVDLLFYDTPHKQAIARVIADSWQKNLGLSVSVSPQDYEGSQSNREVASVWQGEWFATIPQAIDYYRPFLTDGDLSAPLGWSSDDFDAGFEALFGDAPVENPAELMLSLEQLLLDEVVIIPLSWDASSELTKPYILRTPTINGIRAFETWRVTN